MKRKLQVFVSSTYNDLREERQAAVQAILKAGHIPAGMELFTAGDRSQLEIIKNWIDDSDVFMLILGGRYGSIEPKSGKSYIEVEYGYAEELEKPLFAVVIDEKELTRRRASVGEKCTEQDNIELMAAFRTLVLSKICSFFSDPKDIRLAVLETLPIILEENEAVGWVPAADHLDTAELLTRLRETESEAAALREETTILTKKLAAKAGASPEPELDQLRQALLKIRVTFQPDEGSGKPETDSLLAWFLRYKEPFVSGIENRFGASPLKRFLMFKIAPQLKIHGLVEEVKVPHANYQRFRTTKMGDRFLASLVMKMALAVDPQ